uniref:Uncharacterized protein n=1 Tax=Salvator merianae TaxID=96440 RepID=A0A8D0B423_SALMN
MSSMACPFSSFFSISTMSFTPSTTSWTCSTSEEPRRSALEMSNTAPTASVSTPPARPQGSHGGGAGSPQTWHACSGRCPDWRGKSGRSPSARST